MKDNGKHISRQSQWLTAVTKAVFKKVEESGVEFDLLVPVRDLQNIINGVGDGTNIITGMTVTIKTEDGVFHTFTTEYDSPTKILLLYNLLGVVVKLKEIFTQALYSLEKCHLLVARGGDENGD